jgi:hypothetical protein
MRFARSSLIRRWAHNGAATMAQQQRRSNNGEATTAQQKRRSSFKLFSEYIFQIFEKKLKFERKDIFKYVSAGTLFCWLVGRLQAGALVECE